MDQHDNSFGLSNMLLESVMNPVHHLYVHIPFCPSICPYCSFHVLRANKTQAERFLENLLSEYRSIADDLDAATVFFGGGTPTALSTGMLQQLLSALLPHPVNEDRSPQPENVSGNSVAASPLLTSHLPYSPPTTPTISPLPSRFDGFDKLRTCPERSRGARGRERGGGLEVSIECNPSTLSTQKAAALVDLGVNRLSIGAQSFDPTVLQTLGRVHSVAAIHQCVSAAREAGFSNINLDLIFGVPGQTLDSWKATLFHTLALGPQHFSCYGLTYEEDTDFFRRHQRGELRDHPELETEMFHLADEILTHAGYHHYETSNYALAGFECGHNLAYWRGEDFYGIGPSAVSTVRGKRCHNSRMNERGAWMVEEIESLSIQTLAAERMALGLRTSEGIEETAFAAKFGFLPSERWAREIASLQQARLMTPKKSLQLSGRGRVVADEVASYFM